ncbi:MAG: DUF6242 domain-containing protein [Tannerellaceae bacterium]
MLSSCLGTADNPNYQLLKNCQITSFSLKSDSVPGLDKVKFTIDQVNGLIFNLDSMPYGTKIKKVVCTVSFAGGVVSSQILYEGSKDTVWWNATDSLDFAKPVTFKNYAYDGLTTKSYLAQVNIHQVVPDSMVWSRYADPMIGQTVQEQKVIVYTSSDKTESYYMYAKPVDAKKGYQLYTASMANPKSWKEQPVSGLPISGVVLSQIAEYEGMLYVPTAQGALYSSSDGQAWALVEKTPFVKSILGAIKSGVNQPSVLAIIVRNGDALSFAAMNSAREWTTGVAVPANFPISGFGNVMYNSMYHELLMVVAGKDNSNRLTNAAWGTMTATDWVLLTDTESSYFEKRDGVMLTKYDNKLFLVGGINEAGKASKDIILSTDNGVTWSKVDTMIALPKEYKARAYGSMLVDKDNYLLIFGGKESNSANSLDELWRGRINRLGFKKQ